MRTLFKGLGAGRMTFRPALLSALLVLLGAAILWGQILSKEYVRLNGRTIAIEVSPPVVAMLNVPAGGSYPIHTTSQTISFRVDSPVGLDHVEFILDNLWNATDACYILYFPATNDFQFTDSAGNQTSYTLGAGANPASVSNNHCTLNLVNSSVSATATATSATMNLAIALRPSSVGMQNIYITGWDISYNTSNNDSVPRASWTAYDELTTLPPTYSLLQAPVSGNNQTLYFKFSDGNGYRYIDQQAQVMLAYDALGNNSPCYFSFLPAQRFASLDSYTNGTDTYIGSGTFGQGSITGSTCSIDLVNSKLHINPDPTKPDPDPNASLVTDMYLDLVVSLSPSAVHPLGVYSGDYDRAGRGMYAFSPSGTAGFQVGTWP